MCGGAPGGPSHVQYVLVCIRGRKGDGDGMTSSWNSPRSSIVKILNLYIIILCTLVPPLVYGVIGQRPCNCTRLSRKVTASKPELLLAF